MKIEGEKYSPDGFASVDEFNCTPLQQEILQLDQERCSVSLSWELSSMSIDQVLYTWQAVASHNPILRTFIVNRGSISNARYRQVVRNRASTIRFDNSDMQRQPLTDNETATLTITTLNGGLSVCLRMDAALVDYTSLTHIRKDFTLFYGGWACEQHESFSNYVRRVERQDVLVARAYWQNELTDVVHVPIYQIPFQRGSNRSFTNTNLSDKFTDSLRAFADKYSFSLRGLVHAAWALTLSHHVETSNKTVVFVAVGRDMTFAGHNSLVGVADQSYPLKLSVPEHMPLLEWIRIVEKADLDASANAFIGYNQICTLASQVTPHVKVILTDGLDPPEKEIGYVDLPLTLQVGLSTCGTITMHHDSATPRNKIQVLLDHFLAALASIVEDPFASPSAVSVLSPAEKGFLLEMSKPATDTVGGLVNKMLEQQVERTPDAEAVQFEDSPPITYLELNKLSNAVARQLDCGRGCRVPVCLQKSVNLIVAIMSILKTGAAYVTLDPDTPTERNNFIVEDVCAPFVITDAHTRGKFACECSIEALVDNASAMEDADFSVLQEPTDIAYVIYTSGSTGKPKGVLLEHQAAYNGLAAFPSLPRLRQLFFHNPVFSAAQRTIFSTLKQGGCLCLASKENLTVQLTNTINKMRINVIDVTPSTASLITPGSVPLLRRMTVAGELINPKLLPLWNHRLELLNAYGLTEVTQINWRNIMKTEQNPQNIGRPSDTTSSYVLKPGTTDLCPLLVPGELCLGGSQLARCYLNHPEKTSVAFIENPFGPGRLYRTGDMVVTQEDGSIEMVGRIDFQVKVNGQRVEPGEANAILQMHHGVHASCTVSALVGTKRALVAILVLRNGYTWSSLELELPALLRQKLPLYMVPSYWLVRSELPLNINGKVDVPALCQWVQSLDRKTLCPTKSPTQERLTAIEQKLLRIWALVLSLPENHISLSDSFLSLGGTSLEAILVASQAREQSIEISVANILQAKDFSEVAKASHCVVEETTKPPPAPFSLLSDRKSSEWGDIEDAYPVTPFQEAMVASSTLGHSTYIYSRAFRSPISQIHRVKDAFMALGKTNSLLRTTFVEHGKTYLQLIKRNVNLFWEQLDISLDEYLERQRSETMTLGGCFLKVAALPENIYVVTAHHALFDFWSNQFLYEDLASILLGGVLRDRQPFNYFVQYVQQANGAKAKLFWQKYLEGAHSTKLGFNPGKENSVSARLDLDLNGLSSKHKLTIGSLLYASWAIVLSVLTSNEDVVFGITLSGRDAPVPGILNVNGPTLSIVPLRVKINWECSLTEIAQNVQDELWDMAEHTSYGLQNALRASGQASGCFDTMVNYLIKRPPNTPNSILEPIELKQPNHTEYVKLELEGKKLNRAILLSTLNPDKAQMVIAVLVKVLHAFDHCPYSAVRDLNLRSRADSRLIANPSTDQTSNLKLGYSLLENKAAACPEKIALQDNCGRLLSYSSFNEKCNQLAAILRGKGVQPEDIVPLIMEKSLNTLVAMFGIMKSGGAFTPLDPANPVERNSFIIQDVQAKVALTDGANAHLFSDTNCEAIILDDLNLSAYPDGNMRAPNLASDNLAYVIYTSGSTGSPKGVLITHAALAASAEAMIEATGVTDSWRSLWVLNFVFDGSYYDVFTILGAGGTLCLASQDYMLSNLAACINYFDVTQLMLTPTITKLISPEEVPGLKVLLMGGEPLAPHILEWARRITVYSVYGPTETTILVTVTRVKPESNLRSIGRPTKYVSAKIFDIDGLEHVPSGEVGELCISGPQVARGYLKRPGASETVFLNDENNKSLYRTGDLARWLPDGEIELLGRKDYQVKINGYRIELGEIENAILGTGMIQSCVVAVITLQKKQQLVAFCVHSSEEQQGTDDFDPPLLPAEALIKFQHLPRKLTTLTHYMMPTIWLPFATLPLQRGSGKTDRKKLDAIVESIDDSTMAAYMDLDSMMTDSDDNTSAVTEEEQVIRRGWAYLFDRPAESISATTKFLAFGGDSISAINLASACRRAGYDLSVKDILTYPTIREQAKRLRIAQSSRPAKSLTFTVNESVFDLLRQHRVDQDDIENIYPCAPGQVEFLTQGHTKHQFWQLMTVRRLPAAFDFDRWEELTVRLTAKNEILRAMFLKLSDDDPLSWVQVTLKRAVLDLKVVKYNNKEERQALIDQNWDQPFELGKPFVRYRLLVSAEDGTRDLCIKLDHAMYDGTLFRIFDDQFTAMDRNNPVPQPTEFKTMIDYYRTSNRASTLSFWTTLLHSLPTPYLNDLPAPKVSGMALSKISFDVDVAAQTHGVTVPIVFQAAYTLLLAKLARSTDVTYDNLLTGRNVGLDNPQLINGNCANFLPFRSRFSLTTTIPDILRDTQSLIWQTTENGMVSLGDIYGSSRTEKAARTMFCFQPFEPPAKDQEQMRWVVMSLSEVTMYFNYALMVEVFKDVVGYKVKLQFDQRAFGSEVAEEVLREYREFVRGIVDGEATVGTLIRRSV